ncbi:DUF4962 domain-containing protein [Tamlana fucoidanivorans]|uniref:DUF4962 domain-containing protein n=1 Tax=Allotamlana fucoidanivorans TaxID=2583814 RepID=A0A5C4SPZ5_9FLAO|nr:DUF4962 domain-containing protein [Tamlana fucoidanivorans]TNJ46063.1 DUF4962 domain-containing protein [Tamlana fucoidanivorans]
MKKTKLIYHTFLNRFFLLTIIFASISFYGQNAKIINGSEKTIKKHSIYDNTLEAPVPQGMVDENSPWLHFRIPLNKNELGHRLYYFKLSQDSTFTKDVIRSKAKRWSFFNPYSVLKKGNWYWQYGYTLDTTPADIKWSNDKYSFVITGNERVVVPPTPDEVIKRISSTKAPHVVLLKDEIGNLLPSSQPEIKEGILNNYKKLLNIRPEVKVVVDESTYPNLLKEDYENKKFRFFQLSTLKQFKGFANRIESLLKAYLLTGNEEYKRIGLEDFYKLDNEFHTVMMEYGKHPGYPDDFVLEAHIKLMTLILDAFSEDLNKEWKTKIVNLLFKYKKEGYLNFYKQLEFSEHIAYKAHLWQAGVQTLLMSAIVLSPYKEEAQLWLEYAYELWLYRNPAGSRNDGGWHGGNGYFGTNERQLLYTPWVMSKLMGYDYFNHPWYRNVAKYLSYSNPVGNPGLAFGDGNGTDGAGHYNLVEALAHIHADNYWNKWRLKTTGRIDKKWFINKVGENEAPWSLLSVWNTNKLDPDFIKVDQPKELSALFRDIGYVGMHTDLVNPSKNLLLNFRSCPFGQLNHAHPAQNAFNIAYGGEPLFWRTGHYNSIDKHKVYSFKHSRAHNTILANGFGQSTDISGYGWVPRFVTGRKISYTVGDASNAYSGIYRVQSSKKSYLEKEGISVTEANGYGNPEVTRFRRHIAMLRPNHIIVYDELEAKEPIHWTFKLNAQDNMEQIGDNKLSTSNAHARANAQLLCENTVETMVTDKFFSGSALDWRGRQGNGAKNYPNQWHGSFTTTDKLKSTRFLTIIEILPNGEEVSTKVDVIQTKNFTVAEVGDYKVKVELDPNRPSFIEIVSNDETCALVSGQNAKKVELGKNIKTAKLIGNTLFMEKSDTGKIDFFEQSDILPDVLKFGNKY